MKLPNARPGDTPKGISPSLGGGVHTFFCFVSGLQYVGKCVAWIQDRWKCDVVLALMDEMLGQGMCLKARRPALWYANVRLYVFSFIFFVRSAFGGKEIGVVVGFALCHMVCLAR